MNQGAVGASCSVLVPSCLRRTLNSLCFVYVIRSLGPTLPFIRFVLTRSHQVWKDTLMLRSNTPLRISASTPIEQPTKKFIRNQVTTIRTRSKNIPRLKPVICSEEVKDIVLP
jgi:hypothetical protein